MAPELKEKKRKATDSTNAANPPKKNKSKNDKILPSPDLKLPRKPKPMELVSTSASTTKSTVEAPATSAKKGASKKQPASEVVNATTSRVSRKRTHKDNSDAKATRNSDGEQKHQAAPKKRKTHKLDNEKTGRASESATAGVSLDAAEADKVAIVEIKESLSEPPSRGPADYEGDDGDSDHEDVVGDQTAALIRGFEDLDEDDSDENGPSEDEKYKNGEALPKVDIPLKDQAALKSLKKKTSANPGVVYLGRVPHGFYEHEMRAYFGQFGEITRLRLSRSKKTGASKHYAFIEFASADVAEIAAKTMDHYMLFGHLLRCKVIPTSQVPKDLWKGANRRFNKVPWTKLENEKLSKGKTKQEWLEKNKIEQKRRDDRLKKSKSIGYEFKMPELKSPESVFKTIKDATSPSSGPKELEAVPHMTTAAARETPTTAEETDLKQSKKKSKGKNEQDGGSKNKSIVDATNGTHTPVIKTTDSKPKEERKKHRNKGNDTHALSPNDVELVGAKPDSLQTEEAHSQPSITESTATIKESTKKSKGAKKDKSSKTITEEATVNQPASLTQAGSMEVEKKADSKGKGDKKHGKSEGDTVLKKAKHGKPQAEGGSKAKKTKKAGI